MDEFDVIVVMGVSGSGKTTVGRLLAERLGVDFGDADALHSEASLAKLASGEPLTDIDRWPWLQEVGVWIDAHHTSVVACSVLKRSYRELLTRGRPGVRFVYLKADRELLRQRLAKRVGHFMPPKLLDSQLSDLEEPGGDEPARTIPIIESDSPRTIVGRIVAGPARRSRTVPPSTIGNQ